MLIHYLRRSASNTLCYGAASFVTRLIGFLFLPYFLSRLTLKEFGLWDFYQTFFSFGTLILSSCAATALTRFYIAYKDDVIKQHQAVGNALWFVLTSVTIFLCIALYFVRSILMNAYMGITILNICLFALFAMVLVYVRVREQLWHYFLFFCMQALVATAGTVYGVYCGSGIDAFFYANAFSYFLFIPFFAYYCFQYRLYSWLIFKEQIVYSLPLLLNALLYNGFFMIDRFLIVYLAGYEHLGLYSFLWRFGAIFQFFSAALMDARVIVLFNAQKEKNGDALIKKLITYFCLVLASGIVGSIVVSCWAVEYLFPTNYHNLVQFFPLFFLSLAFLEIGRVMATGFSLAAHTLYAPLLALIGLVVQAVLLFILRFQMLWGVIGANIIAFAVYGLANYWYSARVYAGDIVDIPCIGKMLGCLIVYAGGAHLLFLYQASWYLLLCVVLLWPAVLWGGNIIADDEKEWCRAQISKIKIYNRKKGIKIGYE